MPSNNQRYIQSSACISECGRYRYRLYRQWDENRPDVLFVMLNPSTADHRMDDRTITRCVGFARDWCYGGLLVGNLFALRSTNPAELYKGDDPIGPYNDAALRDMAARVDVIVAAWGDNGAFRNRGSKVLRMLSGKCYALKLNRSGHPAHPLYLPGDLKPFPIMSSNDSV